MILFPFQIVHLKRFHYLNGRWIKSHKIVDFPNKNFNPEDFLAAVPAQTLKRFKALKAKNKLPNFVPSKLVSGPIAEVSEPNSLTSNSGNEVKWSRESDDEDVVTAEDVKSVVERLDVAGAPNSDDDDDVFNEDDDDVVAVSDGVDGALSPNCRRRKRQESTSLLSHPIQDDDLQDFHQHKLKGGSNPLDINYNLYSLVVRKIFLSF